MKPTKAIIPVAGYGTRRLPITKSIEKSMLPLLNRPIVDYIVEQCIHAGIKDIYFVIGKGSTQLRSYYETNEPLEAYLLKQGKTDQLDVVKPPTTVNFHYIEQDQAAEAYGTTVPVWLCRDIAEGEEKVLIIMGDQCFYRDDGGSDIADLISNTETRRADGGMIVTTIPKDAISQYGVVDMDEEGNFAGIVEKPAAGETTSNLNNASLYLVPGTFWEFVAEEMKQEHIGEYLITDVLSAFVAAGNTLAVSQAKGKYLDCGTLEGWVAANNYLFEQTK